MIQTEVPVRETGFARSVWSLLVTETLWGPLNEPPAWPFSWLAAGPFPNQDAAIGDSALETGALDHVYAMDSTCHSVRTKHYVK